MRRDITVWKSHRLGRDMPLVSYGQYGTPVLMLPTAAADYLEYERFQLIDSLRWWLDQGKVKLYSVNSVNQLSLLNRDAGPEEKIDWLERYERYILEEVLPFIRHDCQDETIRPILMGISLGSTSAAGLFFRHPDQFSGAMLISGSYDIRPFLGPYGGDLAGRVYFHNPVDYLPNLGGAPLETLRRGGRRILVFSGQGSHEAPDRSRRLADILTTLGVPHWFDLWGEDVAHDWPWWRKCVPYYFGKFFG